VYPRLFMPSAAIPEMESSANEAKEMRNRGRCFLDMTDIQQRFRENAIEISSVSHFIT
jgi:hypothetical protein